MPETEHRPPPPGQPVPPAVAPATATPAQPPSQAPSTDPGLHTVAVVLIDPRVVVVGQHTYKVPAGQVIRILTLPVSQHFDDGMDTKLVPAGDLKVGDHVD